MSGGLGDWRPRKDMLQLSAGQHDPPRAAKKLRQRHRPNHTFLEALDPRNAVSLEDCGSRVVRHATLVVPVGALLSLAT